MILLDIYIPSLGMTYDFRIDENVRIINVLQEISEMLTNKYKSTLNKPAEEFMLCSITDGRVLNSNKTLAENKITNGCKLLMV